MYISGIMFPVSFNLYLTKIKNVALRNQWNIIGFSSNKTVSSYNAWAFLFSFQMVLCKFKNKWFVRTKLNYLLQKETNSKDLINLFRETLNVFHYSCWILMHKRRVFRVLLTKLFEMFRTIKKVDIIRKMYITQAKKRLFFDLYSLQS